MCESACLTVAFPSGLLASAGTYSSRAASSSSLPSSTSIIAAAAVSGFDSPEAAQNRVSVPIACPASMSLIPKASSHTTSESRSAITTTAPATSPREMAHRNAEVSGFRQSMLQARRANTKRIAKAVCVLCT